MPLSALCCARRTHLLALGCLLLCLPGLLSPPAVVAQQKSLLRPARRDYFAGKFVLIPLDTRPVSYQLPRLLAQIADHDIILPPRSLLRDSTQATDLNRVISWARSIDYADADGLIVSLNTVSDEQAAQPALELLNWVRTRRPALPIYGFHVTRPQTHLTNGSELWALELVASGKLDYLILNPDEQSLSASRCEQLLSSITARRLSDRIQLSPSADAAAIILLARHLNRRFGIVPRVLPLFSSAQPDVTPGSAGQRLSGAEGSERICLPLSRSSALRFSIEAIGGREIAITADAAQHADILLFLHTPQTDPQRLASFVAGVKSAIEAGRRVAVVDLSSNRESRSQLMMELRRHKLLGQLIAYAASSTAGPGIATALAQASARLITMKFLRDDLERLQRVERAQIEMLLNRYLSDLVYPDLVRPRLDTFAREQLQADPGNLGEATKRAEDFAQEQSQSLLEEIFSEQFRRNIHSILLDTGARAEFQVRFLQRFQLRLPWQRTGEVEFSHRVYLPLMITGLEPLPADGAQWRLYKPHTLDERLVRQFDETAWSAFDAGAEEVELRIEITSPEVEAAESYSIRSRRKSKRERRIEITAPSARGAFYALARLEQLGAEGKLKQDLELSEAPSFKQRGIVEGAAGLLWSHRDRLDLLRFLGRVRLNRYYYAPKDDPLLQEEGRDSYLSAGLDRFKQLLRAAQENFIELVYALRLGPSITYSREEDFAALTSKLDRLAALGVRHFALFFDALPETLSEAEDRARFPTLAAAQAHLINRAYEHLQRTVPGFSLSVLPTFHSHLDPRHDYLKELGAAIPKEISILWTGARSFSPEETEAQAEQWETMLLRQLLIWAYFPANDSEPWQLYLGPWPGAAPALSEHALGLIANPMSQAHASMLPLATIAEYAWDARHYDPERALERALKLLYDERSRNAVRVWTDVFRDHQWGNSLFTPLFQQQRNDVNVQLVEQRLAEMETALLEIGIRRERGLLRGELASFLSLIRSAIERLKNDPAYERLDKGNYRLRSAQKIRKDAYVFDADRN